MWFVLTTYRNLTIQWGTWPVTKRYLCFQRALECCKIILLKWENWTFVVKLAFLWRSQTNYLHFGDLIDTFAPCEC